MTEATTELVERLRLQQREGLFGVPADHKFVDYGEAADTIERQSTALRDAELGCVKQKLRELVDRSSALMACLETHGGAIVPHLLDTDDNPGQFLRDTIDEARSLLAQHGSQER